MKNFIKRFILERRIKRLLNVMEEIASMHSLYREEEFMERQLSNAFYYITSARDKLRIKLKELE